MDNNPKKTVVKNILICIAVPIIVYAIMEAITMIVKGSHVISSITEFNNLVKNTIQMALTAFALSLNMSSGRMDFSLGAQQMIGCIIGGNIAIRLGLGYMGVILFSIVFGAAAGFVVGTLFVRLRIPSMILGIGMALVYECLCFAFSVDGLVIFGKSVQRPLNSISVQLAVMSIVLFIMIILYQYTGFGYHYVSIQGSQRIAKNMGINVFGNCLVCYTLAGALIALSGVFSAAYTGSIASKMGLGSAGLAFSALLPVFMCALLARYTSIPVALLIGSLSAKIINAALIQLALPNPAVTVINYVIILIFLLISNYTRIFADKKYVKNRIKTAGLEKA